MTLFPDGVSWDGRDAVAAEPYRLKAQSDGQVRSIAIAANRQPAVAIYVRRSGDTLFRAWAVVLLAVQDAKLKGDSDLRVAHVVRSFRSAADACR
jgi:RNA polymerase sigma-70 factor, ECF subfamily